MSPSELLGKGFEFGCLGIRLLMGMGRRKFEVNAQIKTVMGVSVED